MKMVKSSDNNSKQRPKGYEVFEITPVILGGSPTEPDNKILLDREQHIKAVRYWNQVICDLGKGKIKGRES